MWNPIRIESGTAVEGALPVSDTGTQFFYYLEVDPNTPYIVELDRVAARFRPDGADAVKHVAVNLAGELGKGRLLGEQIKPGETGKRIPVRVSTGCLFVEVGSWVHAEPVTFRLRVYPQGDGKEAEGKGPPADSPLTERDKEIVALLRDGFEGDGKRVLIQRTDAKTVAYAFDIGIDIPDESLPELVPLLPGWAQMYTNNINKLREWYGHPQTIRVSLVSKDLTILYAECRFDGDSIRVVYGTRLQALAPPPPATPAIPVAPFPAAKEPDHVAQREPTSAMEAPQAETTDGTAETVGRDRMFLHAMFGAPDHFLITFSHDEDTGQAARTETWGYEALSRHFVFRDGIYAGGRARTFMPTVPDAFALDPLSIHPGLSPTDLPALVGRGSDRTESRPPYTLFVYGEEALVFWLDGTGRLVRVLRAPEEVNAP